MALDGYEEVGETFSAYEDVLLLKPGFVGAIKSGALDANILDTLIVLVVNFLLAPAEANKVDGRTQDASLVEESNNLGTNYSLQNAMLRRCHEPWN